MMKKFLVGLILLALLAGASLYLGRMFLDRWSQKPSLVESETLIEFPRGTSLTQLSEELEARGLVSHAELFLVWARLFSSYNRFQAGNYLFLGEVAPKEIAAKIISGDVYRPIVMEYTIPEGFTFKQIAARLIAKGIGDPLEFEKLGSDPEFLSSLRVPSSSLEGYLYPATYHFFEIPTAKEALSKAVEVFWQRLPADYPARVEEKGISLADAVKIASLIELETSFDDERSLVSEVIWRRLNAGAALAIDASIIYGIEDYAGNLTSKHLRDRKNTYNTRVHRGLPPTPIGSPSVASLEAVLTPTEQGWYYYVLDLETGRHTFSKTLKEHNRHVKKLVRETRRRRIQSRKEAVKQRRAESVTTEG